MLLAAQLFLNFTRYINIFLFNVNEAEQSVRYHEILFDSQMFQFLASPFEKSFTYYAFSSILKGKERSRRSSYRPEERTHFCPLNQ